MNKHNKIRKSLKVSFLDGVCASWMLGLITDYITPFALALKATTHQIGTLSAVPSLLSSFVQLKSADLTAKIGSRKKVVTLFVFLHALMFIPIIFIPRLFPQAPVPFLILFITLFTSLGAFAAPAWSSLMSEYIPLKSRGKYFGWRNKILGMVTVCAAFISGFILHACKHRVLAGFMFIFSLAFVARLFSWYFLTRMYEPPIRQDKDAYFSFLDFVRRIRESNYARFVIFVASLLFCVNIASPFFSVFMLRDLKLNYLTYTILVTTVPIVQIFTIDRWGRHADTVGNIKVLRFTSFFIASLPLWWVLCQHPAYLVCAQILSGFAWAGFNLCATNFIYDAVTPQKRVRCIAYFNVFSGAATCAGALTGGSILPRLPPLFGYQMLTLFLIASIARFCVVVFFSPRIKEVRGVTKVTSKNLFYSVIGIKPMFDSAGNLRQLSREEE